jgi:hypothetical protein
MRLSRFIQGGLIVSASMKSWKNFLRNVVTTNKKLIQMNAELIHIECGIFNGIAIYRLGDKVLKFHLKTPKYNDFGEFRVSTEFIISEYGPKHDGYVPKNIPTTIELTDEQADWWLTEDSLPLPSMEDNSSEVAGGKIRVDDTLVIAVITKDNQVVPFDNWKTTPHDHYEEMMFNVFHAAYSWYLSEDCKKSTMDLMIYSEN